MRKEITEEQITNLMQAIPRAEEVDRLRAEIERLKREPELLRAELISITNAARKALADAYDRAKEVRDAFQQQAP
jgi:hypothetical protein